MSGCAFLVVGADTPWVRGLCEALVGEGARVVGARFAGLRHYARGLVSAGGHAGAVEERIILVPPSFGTRLHWATRAYLTERLTREYRLLTESVGGNAWVLVTNPVAERWTRNIGDERLVYWNYDDYLLYQPERASEIQTWEDALVARAHSVLCASRVQQDRFRERYPRRAAKCHHFPNAVRGDWVALSGSRPAEEGTVGYVGNLGERVDWEFVYRTSEQCRELRFIFVGPLNQNADAKGCPDWLRWRRKALSLGNVEALGPAPYEAVREHYLCCAVNWMPYDVEHPFNIASCPTKIFDALASGRPFVSTALAECELYGDYISIVRRPEEASEVLRSLASEDRPDPVERRLEFAKRNRWNDRAMWLFGHLGCHGGTR